MEKDRSPIQSEPVKDNKDGTIECPLCGKDVEVLETRGKNKGCKECLGNIVTPLYRNLNIGRNDPCICGKKDASGKAIKYKKCCGKG
jgi:hypothetical protein